MIYCWRISSFSVNSSDAGSGIFPLWGSIPCLLMPWLLMSPEHQQAWHWLCKTDEYCCSRLIFINLGQVFSAVCSGLLKNHIATLLWGEYRCFSTKRTSNAKSVSMSLCICDTHYGDVIMDAIASQITSLTIVYSTVYQTQIKENIKAARHWPLCGNSPGTGEFPAQMASNAENVSIWWRHHGFDFFPSDGIWVSAMRSTCQPTVASRVSMASTTLILIITLTSMMVNIERFRYNAVNFLQNHHKCIP